MAERTLYAFTGHTLYTARLVARDMSRAALPESAPYALVLSRRDGVEFTACYLTRQELAALNLATYGELAGR